MTREEWQRVKEILHNALDLPRSGRAAFLDGACDGDLALRGEVESLLASHEEAGTFIEEPVAAASQLTPPMPENLGIGSDLGPYRIVQLIAEGGMGAVYQAVRVDDLYRKVVAVKIIRRGVFGEFALRRFDIERQILAHLDHPNIAKLLDGGATPDGRPFFVMDFIAGTPIDEYCDRHQLGIRERLDFFLTVCSAVHYAHQNLVIHRDLKPGNILVTEEGALKLLDFGIAKLLDPDALDGGTESPTLTTVHAMTPEYASPEQLHGLQVTTASDVYSLGVLLYRLMTGHRPYAGDSRSIEELWEHIRNRAPRRPSTVIAGSDDGVTPEMVCSARNTRPDRLQRLLAGDLDNILMMALRKEPERRYCSVEQFANDVRRHLQGHPVTARPDTIRYRAGKFIQRHRGGVFAAAMVIVTLIAGIITTSWQWHVANRERQRAEQRFQDVRGLANSVLFELHDAIVPLPGSTAARELLIKRAQRYLDSLASEPGVDDSLQHERAMAYERIGDVLGLPVQPNLGQSAGALASYHRALEIERQLADHDYANMTVLRRDMARIYNHLCRVEQETGKFKESLENCRESSRIQEEQLRLHPDDVLLRADLATTYSNMAGAYLALGDYAHTEEQRSQVLREFQELHRMQPDNESFLYGLANAYHRMANLQEQTKHYAAARTNVLQAIELFDQISALHPKDLLKRSDWTFAQQRLGSILISTGDLTGALSAFEQVLPIREQLQHLDPKDARARLNLANSHASIGFVLLAVGQAREARTHFEQQRKLDEELVQLDPMGVAYSYSLSEALENLGRVALRLGEKERGKAYLREALRIYDQLSARGAISAEYAGVPARIRSEMGEKN